MRVDVCVCSCTFVCALYSGTFRSFENSFGGLITGGVGVGVWIRLDAGGCVCAFMYLCGSGIFQYISLGGRTLVSRISVRGCSGVDSFECGWTCVCVYVFVRERYILVRFAR